MPVLLFHKYGLNVNRVPTQIEELVTVMNTKLHELTHTDNDLIPKGYHEARYRTLFNNVIIDQVAVQKIRAGVKLYKFLVDHFGSELDRISIAANMTGYDTVADINCALNSDKIVPVSVKSYSSLANAIKIKSIAWHRLVYNNLSKDKSVSPSLPAELAVTDMQDKITSANKILSIIARNLNNKWHTHVSDMTTVDILKLCILGAQPETIVIDTTTHAEDIVYHDEISEKNINSKTFTGATQNGNVLNVVFGELNFSIVIRYRNKYPQIDIYYNYKNKKV
jgi:hypothetical protein